MFGYFVRKEVQGMSCLTSTIEEISAFISEELVTAKDGEDIRAIAELTKALANLVNANANNF